jgi:hypothetical protein
LTPAGERTLSDAAASVAEHERAIRGDLSEDEASRLVELLRRLRG